MGYSPWGGKELDTTEQLSTAQDEALLIVLHRSFLIILTCLFFS